MPVPPRPPTERHNAYAFFIDRAHVADPSRGASYRDWPDLPVTAMTLVRAVIPQLPLAQNDLIHVGWISSESTHGSQTLITKVISGEPWPDFGPDPPLEAVKPGDFCPVQAAAILRNNVLVEQRQQQLDDILSAWNARQGDKQSRAVAEISQTLPSAAPTLDPIATDILGAFSKGVEVARANNARSTKLVIFSDMSHTARAMPLPDLRGFEVIVALYDRRLPDDRAEGEREWTRLLTERGAKVGPFLGWSATTESALLERLVAGVP